MPGSFENMLKHLMEALGHIIERLIGTAHKAKVSVGTRGSLKPILSLESQLPAAKIREMITFATERICLPLIPALTNQSALEIGDGPAVFTAGLLQHQAKEVFSFEISEPAAPAQSGSGGRTVRGSPSLLPFNSDFFDFIAARFATTRHGDIMKAMKEIGRVTAPGGQGFFTDFHPYGLFAKKGKEQVRPYTSGIRGIEDYYKTARQAGLRIIDLKEAFIDEAFRPLFAVSEIQSYRNLKGTPLAIFVFFFKPQTKSA